MEQEEERQGDVIGAAAIPRHLKEWSCVAAAALVIVCNDMGFFVFLKQLLVFLYET